MVNSVPRPLYPREREPIRTVHKPGWAPELVWTTAEDLASTGIRFPKCRAHSESLYRLSYRGPLRLSEIVPVVKLSYIPQRPQPEPLNINKNSFLFPHSHAFLLFSVQLNIHISATPCSSITPLLCFPFCISSSPIHPKHPSCLCSSAFSPHPCNSPC